MKHTCEECGDEFPSRASYDIHYMTHNVNRQYKCSECEKSYHDNKILNQHIKIHHGSTTEFECKVCDRTFKTNKRLGNHMLTHNKVEGRLSGNLKYTQEEKDEAYKLAKEIGLQNAADRLQISYNTLKNWVPLKEKSKLCSYCNKSFSYEAQLKIHKKAMHEGERRNRSATKYDKQFRENVAKYAIEHGVEQAMEKFDVTDSTLRSWIKIAKNPIMCTICGKLFSRKSQYKRHLLKVHDSEVSHFSPDELDNYVASFHHVKENESVSETFEESDMQEDDMEALNKSDEEQLDEGSPSPTFNVSESFKAKENNDVQKGVDDKCTVEGKSENESHTIFNQNVKFLWRMNEMRRQDNFKEEHFYEEDEIENEESGFKSELGDINTENKSDAETENNFKTENETFTNEEFFIKSEFEPVEDKGSVMKSFNCENLEKINVDAFARNSEGFLMCNLCDSTCKSPADLKRHFVVHTKTKDHKCNICFKQYAYASTLKSHLRAHNEEYRCPKCDKQFTQKDNLNKHIKQIHENPGSFVCTYCSKSFNQKEHLVTHEKKHTGDASFQCEQCDEKFVEKRAFTSHTYKVHGIPKPNVCDICGKGFELSSLLKDHMGVHSEVKQFECDKCDAAFYMQRGLNEHKRRHKEKPHKCDTCGKCFALNSKLIEHMAVHSDVKRFKCDECDAAFHLKRGLNDHKRRHKAQTGEYMGASSVCCGKIFTSKPKLDMHLKCFHEKSNEVFE